MRLRVLCEDRKTENLIRQMCAAWGLSSHEVRVSVAPRARGAANAWVIKNYGVQVSQFRAVAPSQRELGMLVVIDGDNEGIRKRERELADQLAAYETKKGPPAARGVKERIAIFVPTWSIETWLLWLSGDHDVIETVSYRLDVRVKSDRVTSDRGAALAAFLRGSESGLPSLDAARIESTRLRT